MYQDIVTDDNLVETESSKICEFPIFINNLFIKETIKLDMIPSKDISLKDISSNLSVSAVTNNKISVTENNITNDLLNNNVTDNKFTNDLLIGTNDKKNEDQLNGSDDESKEELYRHEELKKILQKKVRFFFINKKNITKKSKIFFIN
eukprot:GHVL01002813.1.p1 GENE.GHVL01002813.1~~GHVL01002813.1.p1  ORF type:complete len:148 (+),score=56.83 GHVL01002813.1:107-550(+)